MSSACQLCSENSSDFNFRLHFLSFTACIIGHSLNSCRTIELVRDFQCCISFKYSYLYSKSSTSGRKQCYYFIFCIENTVTQIQLGKRSGFKTAAQEKKLNNGTHFSRWRIVGYFKPNVYKYVLVAKNPLNKGC